MAEDFEGRPPEATPLVETSDPQHMAGPDYDPSPRDAQRHYDPLPQDYGHGHSYHQDPSYPEQQNRWEGLSSPHSYGSGSPHRPGPETWDYPRGRDPYRQYRGQHPDTREEFGTRPPSQDSRAQTFSHPQPSNASLVSSDFRPNDLDLNSSNPDGDALHNDSSYLEDVNSADGSQPADQEVEMQAMGASKEISEEVVSKEDVLEEEVEDVIRDYTVAISCSHLRKKDIMTESDPVCALYRMGEDGEWELIDQTEAIMNNPYPEFKHRFKITKGDEPEYQFRVYDIDDANGRKFLDHKLCGQLTITEEELMQFGFRRMSKQPLLDADGNGTDSFIILELDSDQYKGEIGQRKIVLKKFNNCRLFGVLYLVVAMVCLALLWSFNNERVKQIADDLSIKLSLKITQQAVALVDDAVQNCFIAVDLIFTMYAGKAIALGPIINNTGENDDVWEALFRSVNGVDGIGMALENNAVTFMGDYSTGFHVETRGAGGLLDENLKARKVGTRNLEAYPVFHPNRQTPGTDIDLGYDTTTKAWYNKTRDLFKKLNATGKYSVLEEESFIFADVFYQKGDATARVALTKPFVKYQGPGRTNPSFEGVFIADMDMFMMSKNLNDLDSGLSEVYVMDQERNLIAASNMDGELTTENADEANSYLITTTAKKVLELVATEGEVDESQSYVIDSVEPGSEGQTVRAAYENYKPPGGLFWFICSAVPVEAVYDKILAADTLSGTLLTVLAFISLAQVYVLLSLVPIVYQVLEYKTKRFRLGRLNKELVMKAGSEIWVNGPPTTETDDDEENELYRQMTFDDKPIPFSKETLLNGAFVVSKFKLDWPKLAILSLGLLGGTIAVLIFFVLNWAGVAESQVDETQAQLVEVTNELAISSFNNLFSLPTRILDLCRVLFYRELGDDPKRGINVNQLTVLNDQLMMGILSSFAARAQMDEGGGKGLLTASLKYATPAGWLAQSGSDGSEEDPEMFIRFVDQSTNYSDVCRWGEKGPMPLCMQQLPTDQSLDRQEDAPREHHFWSRDCNYKVRQSPWYQQAVKARKPSWTKPYVDSLDGQIGITKVYPFYEIPDGPLLAVFAVDIKSENLNDILNDAVPPQAEKEDFCLLVNEDLDLLGASLPVETTRRNAVFNDSTSITNPQIAYTTTLLQTLLEADKDADPDDAVKRIPGAVSILPRLIEEPIVSTAFIKYDDNAQYWLLMATDTQTAKVALDDFQSPSLVLMSTTFVMLVVISTSFFSAKQESVETKKGSDIDGLTKIELEPKAFASALEQISEFTTSIESEDPVKLAAQIVETAFRNENAIAYLAMFKVRKLWLYKISYNSFLNGIFQVVMLIHLFIVPVKMNPNVTEEPGLHDGNKKIYIACLLFEFVWLGLRFLIVHSWIGAALEGCNFDEKHAIPRLLNSEKHSTIDKISAAMVLLALVDFIVLSVSGDSTLSFLPIIGILFLFSNQQVFQSAVLFFRTLGKATSIILLFFASVLIEGTVAFCLFWYRVNYRNEKGGKATTNTYRTIYDSLTTIIGFVFGGDNTNSTVYPGKDEAKMFFIFWVITAVVGLYFMTAMVLAISQAEFSIMHKRALGTRRMRFRAGLILTFSLLDADGGGTLDSEEFGAFCDQIKSDRSEMTFVESMLSCMCFRDPEQQAQYRNRHFKNKAEMEASARKSFAAKAISEDVNVLEFTHKIAIVINSFFRPCFANELCGLDWGQVVQGRYYQTSKLLLTTFQLCIISTYPFTYIDNPTIDSINFLLMLLSYVDVGLEIFAYGFAKFWSLRQFQPDPDFFTFANRLDLVVAVVSFFLYMYSVLATGCFPIAEFSKPVQERCTHFEGTDTQHSFAILAFGMSTFRFVSIIHPCRRLTVILLSILPRFMGLMQLYIVLANITAIIGMKLYAAGWAEVEEPPNGDFTELFSAYVMLFELLLMNDWSYSMFSAKEKYGTVTVYFFVLYVIVISTLFMNLFMGVLLDAFTGYLRAEKEENDKARLKMLSAEDPEQVLLDLAIAKQTLILGE